VNRRFFLQLVAAGMSAELADRLLWVPKSMITVPAMPDLALDPPTGLSIRFLKQWELLELERRVWPS